MKNVTTLSHKTLFATGASGATAALPCVWLYTLYTLCMHLGDKLRMLVSHCARAMTVLSRAVQCLPINISAISVLALNGMVICVTCTDVQASKQDVH